MKEELATSVVSHPGTEDPGQRASILLVDDREENLIALEAILKDLGQGLVKAGSGQEALRLLFDRDFAVILLDVRMPDMDGFETAEFIRKRQRSRHTPIIFITAADASPGQITRGYSAGAVDYIFKPFMPEVLKAKVRIFLDLYKKTEELRESEVRFRTLVTNVPGAMYRREAAPPWDMLFLSDPIEKLSGYPASDFMERRRTYASIIHPEDVRALSEALGEAVRKGTPYALEYRVLHAEGGVRWVFDRGQGVVGDLGTVRHVDGVLLEITDRKVAEEELRQRTAQLQVAKKLRDSLRSQAIRDPLTGLFNRRYLDERLERELRRAAHDKRPVGLIMLDLDRLKACNDSFGHEAGDTLLRAVGSLLQEHTRSEDLACRYGGDEFALVLPKAPLDITRQRAEELRNEFKHLNVRYGNQVLGTFSLSLGISAFPDHGTTPKALLQEADKALYQAKAGGGNRVVVGQTPRLKS